MSGKKFNLFPTVKAEDEDIVDPQQTLRDKCAEDPKTKGLYEKYQTCNARVQSRKQTAETCTEELFDYFHMLDHCAAKDLFSKLK